MKNELIISQKKIESLIFTFREVQVMLDRDLAEIYQVETRVLNQAVKRNIDRFPEAFRFQLTEQEFEDWKSQIVMSDSDKMGLRRPPHVFTEQGIAMLSAVLRSDIAIKVSIQIMNAFIEMRKIFRENLGLLQRMDGIELKQLETDRKIEEVFKALEHKKSIPEQGLFYDGQIFDAYEFTSRLIKSANKTIVLIDNYISEETLTHLSKKKKGVKVYLLTKNINKQLKLDVKKANQQYAGFNLFVFDKSHDRFLILDGVKVYHLGASLKDLGKKWFAFSKMNSESLIDMLKKVEDIVGTRG